MLGRNPLFHCRAAIGWLCDPPSEVSTTKPGRSSDSLPSPYSSHDPMLGRPGSRKPVFMKVCAVSWLICSVCIERTMQMSSAMLPMWGSSEVMCWPLRP